MTSDDPVLLSGDILDVVAMQFERSEVPSIAAAACVCSTWRCIFQPRVTTTPDRLTRRLHALMSTDELRRPTLWRQRRRVLLDNQLKTSDLRRTARRIVAELNWKASADLVLGAQCLLAGHRGEPCLYRAHSPDDAWLGSDHRRTALRLLSELLPWRTTTLSTLRSLDPAAVPMDSIRNAKAILPRVFSGGQEGHAAALLGRWAWAIIEEAEFFHAEPDASPLDDEVRSVCAVAGAVRPGVRSGRTAWDALRARVETLGLGAFQRPPHHRTWHPPQTSSVALAADDA